MSLSSPEPKNGVRLATWKLFTVAWLRLWNGNPERRSKRSTYVADPQFSLVASEVVNTAL